MANFKDLLKKWFYTNSSQAASRDARVPLLTESGEPKGSDTMSNLASVLGEITTFGTNINGKDLNDYIAEGNYWFNNMSIDVINGPASMPKSVYHLKVIQCDNDVNNTLFSEQILVLNYSRFWVRVKYGSDNWQSWKECSFDIPSFYKNYATLAALSTGLGVFKFVKTVEQGEDVFGLDTSGWYQAQSYTLAVNLPSDASTSGIIIVFALTPNRRFIMYIDVSRDVYTNRMWDGNWSTWKKMGS